jgi:pimeloyl-ACP methyl ester carboxylesterase
VRRRAQPHFANLSLAQLFHNSLAAPGGAEAFTKYMLETTRPRPMRDLERRLSALRKWGKPFPVPLLLVYAEEDPIVPPEIGSRFAELIPSARLVRLPQASHFAHVDAPQEFARVALDFFD